MHTNKQEHAKKDHAAPGSCSTGGAQKPAGSCGTDSKKTVQEGSCSTGGDKGKKGSCGG